MLGPYSYALVATLAGFVEAKTGIPPRLPEPAAADEATSAEDEATAAADAHSASVLEAVHSHDCIALSARYQACLRHKPASIHRECAADRHDYLLCMTGKWAVHPDHHRELAGLCRRQAW